MMLYSVQITIRPDNAGLGRGDPHDEAGGARQRTIPRISQVEPLLQELTPTTTCRS
jgi:hypothetical protein